MDGATVEVAPADPLPPRHGRLGALLGGVRGYARRRRAAITVVGSVLTAAALVVGLAGQRHDFSIALSNVALTVLTVAALLQIVALLARTEAWHVSIEAAGGSVARRILYRASSMQVLGSVLNGQLGVAARITALRRSSPTVSPQVPTLIAAEFPILAVEATLAALTSFTLIGPLGLPWWLPVIVVAVVGTASAGLRHLALSKGRELWRGLAVLRSLRGGGRVIAFVLVAVFAQILRTWMLLHAVGVRASFFDAIAVLIAVVALGQLPVGPGVGAGGRRPYPGPPRRGRCRRGGGADDGHRDRRRPVLRGVVRRRPALGPRPPDPLPAADPPRVELSRHRRTHDAPDPGRPRDHGQLARLRGPRQLVHMYIPSPLAPRGSAVPGVIPEPVASSTTPYRPAAPRRWHPVTNLVARLLSVSAATSTWTPLRADRPRAPRPPGLKSRGLTCATTSPPACIPAGTLDATSGPRGPRTGSQTEEG
jgi:uncharacterized membrane protein YbhN (UPF0104 family)